MSAPGGRVGAPSDRIQVNCNCGWNAKGDPDEVVARTREHVRDVHWQEVEREDVLEMAEPYDGD